MRTRPKTACSASRAAAIAELAKSTLTIATPGKRERSSCERREVPTPMCSTRRADELTAPAGKQAPLFSHSNPVSPVSRESVTKRRSQYSTDEYSGPRDMLLNVVWWNALFSALLIFFLLLTGPCRVRRVSIPSHTLSRKTVSASLLLTNYPDPPRNPARRHSGLHRHPHRCYQHPHRPSLKNQSCSDRYHPARRSCRPRRY